jgi:ABC-type sugar transport system substrate-binding protein
MRFTTAIAAATAAAALAVLPPHAAAKPSGAVATTAKTCGRGFTPAIINGAQKCLRRGEFCSHSYDQRAPRHWPYSHYGYRCIKQDAKGSYHLT